MQEAFEKIIEKLEEQKAKGFYDSNSIIGEKNVWAKAIEIVNQESEAHNNEFCEWRLYDEDSCTYDTDCRNMHIFIDGSPSENNYLYCPYCGKMIKPYQPKGE